MRVVPKTELYSLLKKEHNQSLWSFVNVAQENNLIDEKTKETYLDWINLINYKHHNETGFYDNLEKIFVEDGISHFINGQEDLGAIALNNSVVIVRNAEMGVAFTLSKLGDEPISKDDWKDHQRILSAIDLAFNNPKDFHLLKSFDKMNRELKNKDSVKEHKVKI
jgi:hypothetical protein